MDSPGARVSRDRLPWRVRRRIRRAVVGLVLGLPLGSLTLVLVTADTTKQTCAIEAPAIAERPAPKPPSLDAEGRIVAFWSVATDRGARGAAPRVQLWRSR